MQESGYIKYDMNRLLPMFVGAEGLKVDYDPDKYARTKDPELEGQIEQVWKDKTAKNDRIYNASKFRHKGFFRKRSNKFD